MQEHHNKISFKVIWSAFMSVVYLVLAYLIAFTPLLLPYNFREGDTDNDDFQIVRILLSVIFLIYGIFRGYRVFKYKK